MTKGHAETVKLASAVLEVHKPRPAEWTGWLRAQMALVTMARLKRDDPRMSDYAASTETAKLMFCRKTLATDVWNKAVDSGLDGVSNCLDAYSEREDGRKGQNAKRAVPRGGHPACATDSYFLHLLRMNGEQIGTIWQIDIINMTFTSHQYNIYR